MENLNDFNWETDENIWSDKEFIFNKLVDLSFDNLKEQIPLVSIELWKDNELLNKLCNQNADFIFTMFSLSPIYSNWTEQAQLEVSLLENINDKQSLYKVWDSYLYNSYIFMHRPDDFLNFLNKDGKAQYSVQEKVSKNYITMLYSQDYNITREQYKPVIDFISNKILNGKIYEQIKYEDFSQKSSYKGISKNESLFDSQNTFKNHVINNYLGNNYSDFCEDKRGEIYIYLPEELRNNENLIKNYLVWANTNLIGYEREKRHYPRYNFANNKYTDINVVPEKWLNELSNAIIYFDYTVFHSKDSNDIQQSPLVTFQELKNNLSFAKHLENRKFWEQLFEYCLCSNESKIKIVWDDFLPNKYKSDKSFIINLLDIYDNLTEKIKASPNSYSKVYNDWLSTQDNFNTKLYFKWEAVHIYKSLKKAICNIDGNSVDNANNLSTDLDIQKTLLKVSGQISEIINFDLSLLDMSNKEDRELIKVVIYENINIFSKEYEDKNKANPYLENNKNILQEWKRDVNLIKHFRGDISQLKLTEELWETWLSHPDAMKLLPYNVMKHIPSHFHSESRILKVLKEGQGYIPFEIEDKYWESTELCYEVLNKTDTYIKKIPDKHWNNREFITKVFIGIDEGKIKNEVIKQTPLRVQQFFKSYGITSNYGKFLNSFMLKEKLEQKIEPKSNAHVVKRKI